MKIYALRDAANEGAGILAYLECYERPQSFFFELPPDADPWALPFVLHEFAQRGCLTVGNSWSQRWVRSRLVPPERQNLGEILRENGLSDYDEAQLLALTGGRCSQDDCHLEPVVRELLPEWYQERAARRLTDVFALDDFRLLALYRSGEAMLVPAQEVAGDRRSFVRVLSDAETFANVRLQAGGHGVAWGSMCELSAEELRPAAEPLPLGAHDMALLVGQAICDTAEAMELLGCTRQNISDLVRRGKLVPLDRKSVV